MGNHFVHHMWDYNLVITFGQKRPPFTSFVNRFCRSVSEYHEIENEPRVTLYLHFRVEICKTRVKLIKNTLCMYTAMKYCKKIAKYNNLEPANTKDIIGIRPIYIHQLYFALILTNM